ncbi:hypothetical protein M6B38_346140 [Iris pallida]|uniref:Uncharacterized protein n=1 Tax=Iris pallida TaxID=29817 RepID=A0AAX6GV08_IRIPA|nr:hypothetical protein M6B38_346140 [Iris pallida]
MAGCCCRFFFEDHSFLLPWFQLLASRLPRPAPLMARCSSSSLDGNPYPYFLYKPLLPNPLFHTTKFFLKSLVPNPFLRRNFGESELDPPPEADPSSQRVFRPRCPDPAAVPRPSAGEPVARRC